MKKTEKEYQKELLQKLSGNAYLSEPCVSATDCTGITQRIPENEYVANSYTDIYDVPVSAHDGAQCYKKTIKTQKKENQKGKTE